MDLPVGGVEWILLATLFQLLLTVPHELGHALAGRWLGYRNIRILIGSGLPLWHFTGLGFQWLINRVPFGGLTLAEPPAKGVSRTGELIFVAAGPGISVVFILLWLWLTPGAVFDNLRKVSGAFAIANLIVLAANLIPRRAMTAYGVMANDGLLLWNTLCHWNEFPAVTVTKASHWRIVLHRVVKWIVVALAGAAFFALGVLLYVVLWERRHAFGWVDKALLAGFLAALMVASFRIGRGIAREPVLVEPVEPESLHPSHQLMAELSARSAWFSGTRELHELADGSPASMERTSAALRQHPEDPLLLLLQADQLLAQGKPVEAGETMDRLLATVQGLTPVALTKLMGERLRCLLQQGDISRVDQLRAVFLEGLKGESSKLRLLDELICHCLYEETPPFLAQAEAWAREALALAPATLTLKGTLGAVLVERGALMEAEPLLRECVASPALHDQGIATFYLGVIEAGKGNFVLARKLARQALVLEASPWLARKANRRLREWEGLAAGRLASH